MAEEQDQDSKTEEPTSKKLSDARERGQVVKSQEVGHLMMLTAMLALVALVMPWSTGRIVRAVYPYWEKPHLIPADPGGMGEALSALSLELFIALAPPMVLLLVAGFAGTVIQVGFLTATENFLKFNFGRISPLSGLKQKVSLKNVVEFAKSLGKLLIVGIVVMVMLRPMLDTAEHYIGLPLEALMAELQSEAVKIILAVVVVLAVIALADYLYQRFEFMQQMRMTKQEVKDEFKQTEGDPLIKAKIRQLRMQRARGRMMQEVPKADVVVTNPTHFAVALKYDPMTMAAPKVVAKGADLVAKRIRELAEEHGVPILSNPPLARALYATAEVDEEVPAEHYKAVAQVISYVFKLKRRTIPNR